MIDKIAEKYALSTQGARTFIRSSVLEFINNLVSMLPMALFLYLLYDVSTAISNRTLLKSGLFYLLLGIVVLILLFVSNYATYTELYVGTYKESAQIRLSLAQKMKQLPMSFYSKKAPSEIASVMLNDVADLENFFSHGMPKITGLIPFVGLTLLALLAINWKLALVSGVVIPLSWLIFQGSSYMEKKAHQEYFSTITKQSDYFQEMIEKMRETRLLNRKKEAKKEMAELLAQQEKTHRKTELPTAISQGMIAAVLQSGIGLVIIFGSYWYTQHELTLIELLIFLIATNKMYNMMISIYEKLSMSRNTKIRIERVKSLYHEKNQMGDTTPAFSNYNFELKNLGFEYKVGQPVLKNVNFTANEGEITALVGPSGSGKSTMLRILSRLYDYDKGNVLLGGYELQNIATNYLFEHISVVFQEVVLFNTSILENIRMGKKDATDQEVLAAAKKAQCDEFALHLEQGYDSIIGENGALLSGGERQRISIARAFLKDSPILFLDETSSALDSENEYAVQQALSKLVKGKTVLVVAHRLKTIENADKIIVLESGSVLEQGNKEQLLARDGMFKRQYQYEMGALSDNQM